MHRTDYVTRTLDTPDLVALKVSGAENEQLTVCYYRCCGSHFETVVVQATLKLKLFKLSIWKSIAIGTAE